MTRAACMAVGLLVGLGLGVSSLEAQITGPEVGRKGTAVSTADEAVARLVHEPIKLLGAGRFGSQEAVVALKALVVRADAGVRTTVRALAAGEMDAAAAQRSMEQVLSRFHSAVDELLEEHRETDSSGG